MKKKFFILGAGGLAEEVFGWIKSDNSLEENLLLGFIRLGDNDPKKIFGKECLSLKEVSRKFKKFHFLPAIANPLIKSQRIDQVIKLGGFPVSYIHSSVVLGENLTIGEGNIINPRCSISSNVIIGDYNLINCNSSIGHGTKIGNYVSLLGSVTLNGEVTVGDSATVGSGVIVHPGKTIGALSNCGLGSVIIRNVKEKVTVYGNPAKVLKK